MTLREIVVEAFWLASLVLVLLVLLAFVSIILMVALV